MERVPPKKRRGQKADVLPPLSFSCSLIDFPGPSPIRDASALFFWAWSTSASLCRLASHPFARPFFSPLLAHPSFHPHLAASPFPSFDFPCSCRPLPSAPGSLPRSTSLQLPIYPQPQPPLTLIESPPPLTEHVRLARESTQHVLGGVKQHVDGVVSKWVRVERKVECESLKRPLSSRGRGSSGGFAHHQLGLGWTA